MSFKRLDTEDVTISAESIVAPAWSGQQPTLTTLFTSAQASQLSGRYYHDIYQLTSTTAGAAIQFTIAYGNRKGSGSVPFDSGIAGYSPSSVIYGQYRTLLNGDEDTDFTFGTSTPNSIYVISVNRSRYKEKLAVGTMTLVLSGSGNNRLTLTDNSKTSATVSYADAGRVYDIVSGAAGVVSPSFNAFGNSQNFGPYGKFYPDVGIMVLNGVALYDATGSGGLGLLIDESPSVSPSNKNVLSGSRMVINGKSFTLQSEETVTSNYVFVRVRNSEFNYSTNPSYITGSGELRYDVMINTPQAYITTVGLYNDNNDLLAVAKLSKPLLKDFTKEALIRIKLDY
jgi:hypothetical protein